MKYLDLENFPKFLIYVIGTIITDTTADKFIFNVSASLICICQQFIMHNVEQKFENNILYANQHTKLHNISI